MIFKIGDTMPIIHCKSEFLLHGVELIRWKVMLYMPESPSPQFQ